MRFDLFHRDAAGARAAALVAATGLALMTGPGCAAKSSGSGSGASAVASAPAGNDDAFVTYDQVDDSLSSRIKSVRYRVTYAEDDMWRGATGGPLVTIVDFSDLECPHCEDMAWKFRKIVNENPDDVRVVVKFFPLTKHPAARPASEAVLAAHAQGKGFEMYDLVFENSPALAREQLISYAEQAGVPDMERFTRELDDGTHAAEVDADISLGKKFKVRSTPSFFVNGRPESGVKTLDELRQIVSDEKIFARKLVEAGSARNEVYARIMRAGKEERWATW